MARTEAVNAGATVAMAYPAPAQAVAKTRSRKRLYAIIAAAAILLLLISSVVLIAALRTPTLTLSSSTVTAGDPVLVSATNVPGNQNGEIQLRSTLHIFTFHADSNGHVSVPIVVPRNIGAGDHTVTICWASKCRNSVTLHVLEPVAFVTPTPGATPTQGPTPTATPNHSPTPSASASPTARPSSSPAPVISVSPYNVKRGTTETVYGTHFSPGSSVTITFFSQGSTTPMQVGTQSVSSSGYFTQAFTVPASAAPGAAAVKVCGTAGCLYATVNVTA